MDYYQVLGVPRTAGEKEIRQAYRRVARQCHPDLNPNDKAAEARFKRIQEAYDVLADPEKRKKYDRFGADWVRAERAAGRAGQSEAGGFRRSTATEGDFQGFGDLFEQLFGRAAGARAGARGGRGEDMEYPVEITLEEALSGAQRKLQIQLPPGRPRLLEVKIPAGVADGSRVRIAGQGEPGIGGGPAGDLYLLVSVLPHPVFERRGDDLYVKVNLPLDAAVLGGEVEVPTPQGTRLSLRVPAETQNGQTFRLKGQGMPPLHGGARGDLYAEARVALPTHLSQREKELFQELAALRAGKGAVHGP